MQKEECNNLQTFIVRLSMRKSVLVQSLLIILLLLLLLSLLLLSIYINHMISNLSFRKLPSDNEKTAPRAGCDDGTFVCPEKIM